MEELYYPCSQIKGADQLCSYCEADLRLCFLHIQNVGFLMTRLFITIFHNFFIIHVPSKSEFWIYKAEEIYYPCSEHKGADQMYSYAPLFSHRQKSGFLMMQLI